MNRFSRHFSWMYFPWRIANLFLVLFLPVFGVAWAGQPSSPLKGLTSRDALIVAGPDGRIVFRKNETRKCTPASTLKILTGLASIHHFGPSYRFKTEFYVDDKQNLKIKGFGDPVLVSEVWEEIGEALATRLEGCGSIVVDDTYFSRQLNVPGVGSSTNPYDAPNGALCANFNTVFFKRDKGGRIVSAEPQTPLTPLAREKVQNLGVKKGRHTFSHDRHEAARYAGELLRHKLRERGFECPGGVKAGQVDPADRLVYTYHSVYTLEQVVEKMLEFSNNFIANQLVVALGAHVQGPPGSLEKGVGVLSDYVRNVLGLENVQLAEGSGISRQNQLSALDMLNILKHFEPYRHLLVQKRGVMYKTGTLTGVRTRAGYMESRNGDLYYFAVFLNGSSGDIDSILDYVKKSIDHGDAS
jgi:D-alanyl-D-alanine carboxypeptidase/D-alanyl-D-alanine-endopeptidase (penicillin-binding protein 4)